MLLEHERGNSRKEESSMGVRSCSVTHLKDVIADIGIPYCGPMAASSREKPSSERARAASQDIENGVSAR